MAPANSLPCLNLVSGSASEQPPLIREDRERVTESEKGWDKDASSNGTSNRLRL